MVGGLGVPLTFNFQIAEAQQGVIPSLLQGCGDQAVGGIDGFIAALGKLGVISGPINSHAPLCANCLVSFLQSGQGGQSQFRMTKSRRPSNTCRL